MSDTVVNILSFGFKYGLPSDADFIFDVRCLPNPYWVDEMREMSGFDEQVREYVFSDARSADYLASISRTVEIYLENTKKENVNVYVGCTGGQHRSVAFAIKLSESVGKLGYTVRTSHREEARFRAEKG